MDVQTVGLIVTKLSMGLDGHLGSDIGQVLSASVLRGLRERRSKRGRVDQRVGEGDR